MVRKHPQFFSLINLLVILNNPAELFCFYIKNDNNPACIYSMYVYNMYFESCDTSRNFI